MTDTQPQQFQMPQQPPSQQLQQFQMPQQVQQLQQNMQQGKDIAMSVLSDSSNVANKVTEMVTWGYQTITNPQLSKTVRSALTLNPVTGPIILSIRAIKWGIIILILLNVFFFFLLTFAAKSKAFGWNFITFPGMIINITLWVAFVKIIGFVPFHLI